MSTLQKVNFTNVSDILPIQKRDFSLTDPTLANPLNPVVLVDGEWMVLDVNYKVIRATDITSVGAYKPAAASVGLRSFPVWAERGRSDVQAMSRTAVPLLWRGEYEFDTRIFDVTATPHGGAAITFIMQPLKVATITFGGRNFTGLVGHGAPGGGDVDPIVGYCTRLPTSNGGQLRFISGWAS
jgi:hypothetical protein